MCLLSTSPTSSKETSVRRMQVSSTVITRARCVRLPAALIPKNNAVWRQWLAEVRHSLVQFDYFDPYFSVEGLGYQHFLLQGLM
jgi:hypothetical protein